MAAPLADVPVVRPAEATETVEAEAEARDGQTETHEQRIKARAEQRWEALVNRDFESAYAFETPGYRKTSSLGQFQAQFGSAVKWLGASVSSVDIAESGDRAEVQLQLSYQGVYPSGGGYKNQRSLSERWVVSEDEWWYVRD